MKSKLCSLSLGYGSMSFFKLLPSGNLLLDKQGERLPGQFLIWVSSMILVRSHKNSIWELLEKFLRILWDFHEILSLRKDRFFILTLMSFLKKFSHGYSQIFFSIDYLRVFKENFLNSKGWLLLIFTVTSSLLPQGGSSYLKSFRPAVVATKLR